MNNLRTDAINLALRDTLSEDRLSGYLAESNGNLAEAIDLYEKNTQLSEALYTPLQSMEVCFRNTLDRQMVAAYGENWLTSGSAPLQASEQEKIRDAVSESGSRVHSKLVSSLKFSFWVGLVASRYDDTLWRKALHKGFKATTGKRRADVHGRFNALRRFRNRVAHHEPIYKRAEQMHGEALDAIGWMCRDTLRWTENQSNFRDTLVRYNGS